MIPRYIAFALALTTVMLLGCTGQVTNTKHDTHKVLSVSTEDIPACEHLGLVELKKFVWLSHNDVRAELKQKMKEIVAERGGNGYHINIFDRTGTSGYSVYLLADSYKCPDTIKGK